MLVVHPEPKQRVHATGEYPARSNKFYMPSVPPPSEYSFCSSFAPFTRFPPMNLGCCVQVVYFEDTGS